MQAFYNPDQRRTSTSSTQQSQECLEDANRDSPPSSRPHSPLAREPISRLICAKCPLCEVLYQHYQDLGGRTVSRIPQELKLYSLRIKRLFELSCAYDTINTTIISNTCFFAVMALLLIEEFGNRLRRRGYLWRPNIDPIDDALQNVDRNTNRSYHHQFLLAYNQEEVVDIFEKIEWMRKNPRTTFGYDYTNHNAMEKSQILFFNSGEVHFLSVIEYSKLRELPSYKVDIEFHTYPFEILIGVGWKISVIFFFTSRVDPENMWMVIVSEASMACSFDGFVEVNLIEPGKTVSPHDSSNELEFSITTSKKPIFLKSVFPIKSLFPGSKYVKNDSFTIGLRFRRRGQTYQGMDLTFLKDLHPNTSSAQ